MTKATDLANELSDMTAVATDFQAADVRIDVRQARGIIAALRATSDLQEALKFYANSKTWHGRVGDKGALLEPIANDDGGKVAREALVALDNLENVT